MLDVDQFENRRANPGRVLEGKGEPDKGLLCIGTMILALRSANLQNLFAKRVLSVGSASVFFAWLPGAMP